MWDGGTLRVPFQSDVQHPVNFTTHPNWYLRIEMRRNHESPPPKKKIGDSCPLDEDSLIKFITVYDDKEIDNEEVEGEFQLLTAYLFRKGLKFAIRLEQHVFTHDPGIELALKCQCYLV
ncbi:hypothetical protein TNCV_2578711 [Trichonephila clavipes]|nr:hypothetical protein TNCV_2578711 [Trichonephila clavipes]